MLGTHLSGSRSERMTLASGYASSNSSEKITQGESVTACSPQKTSAPYFQPLKISLQKNEKLDG